MSWQSREYTAVYLGCQDVEVASTISPADEFTPVIGGHSRVLGYPHHRGVDTVTVETAATVRTLLLTITFTYTEEKGGEGTGGERWERSRGKNVTGHSCRLSEPRTCVRAVVQVAGAVFDPNPLAVFTPI